MLNTFDYVFVNGNVTPQSHFTNNWKVVGDSQTISVEIMESNTYEIHFKCKPIKPGTVVCIKLDRQSFNVSLTTKTDYYLGDAILTKGKSHLKIEIVSVVDGESEAFQFKYAVDGVVVKKNKLVRGVTKIAISA